MTLDDLVDVFRARMRDTAEPPLWTRAEVVEFADDAENEAAERASLLRDTTTAAICEVDVVAGTAAYTLDDRILRVERAKLDLGTVPLSLSSTAAMDRGAGVTPKDWRTQSLSWQSGGADAGWEQRTGTPALALIDREGAAWKLRLVPIPVVDDTMRLHVIRLPLEPLSVSDGSPEIPARLHVRLVDWMVYRAYSKQDSETFDRTKASEAEAAFTRSFGECIDANARRKQDDRAPCVTVFQEF